MAPSRSFLTRQACLNALKALFPATLAFHGAPGTLKLYEWEWNGWTEDCCSAFITRIREEYRILAEKYEAAQ